MTRKAPLLLLDDVRRLLAQGHCVVHSWKTGVVSINDIRLDGRTYQGFLTTLAPTLKRVETGGTDIGDLVITWKS